MSRFSLSPGRRGRGDPRHCGGLAAPGRKIHGFRRNDKSARWRLAGVWIGTSGYVYPHWRKGAFYPAGLPQRDELAYYAARYRTVELNNPFYRLPAPESFLRWASETPDDFRFAVKASRFITHLKRLNQTEDALTRLLEHAGALGAKLGPVLFQLPPTFHCDLSRLDGFLRQLPIGRLWTIEFRHPSWHTRAVYDLLGRRGVALCVPVGGKVQPDLVTTAPFAYFRMHLGEALGGGFELEQLRTWAGRIRALRRAGKEVYVYFNNDRGAHAVRDAARLRLLLGIER
jgi:uncharacterized protein YecE (DUF72 family)